MNVFVGGPPAMTVAAVMPLPEGMSELAFAGLLNRRRVPMICRPDELAIHAEADFCITGYLEPKRELPEGPFGDHLGYYSLAHDFPVMRVERVYHRARPIWPFTVVGRPPQEDAMFGQLIHELVGPVIPKKVPGVHAVHAVEAAGVHPLLLAIGSERYVPYEEPRRPRELLTLANAILGEGQLSLAKYLFIVAREDNPELDVQDVTEFFRHVLARADWRRNLHFQTATTIDTLDYSGDALNQGSKLVVAVAGPERRTLPVAIDSRIKIPTGLGFHNPKVVLPGILVVEGPAFRAPEYGRRGDGEVRGQLPPLRCDQQLPADRGGRRERVHRPHAEQFPLGHLHAEQSGRRSVRHRVVHGTQALGMPGLAGDRRPLEASARPAAGRGPRGQQEGRRSSRPRQAAARDHLGRLPIGAWRGSLRSTRPTI